MTQERNKEIDLEAACLVAAIIRVRKDQGKEITFSLIIREVHRMAHYLQDNFGREHFSYMADYDQVIQHLAKTFLPE